MVALPAGSTPVDFAYAVHTEVGHRCIGGRVNGRLVPLESPLENGDVVEALTSKAPSAGPSRDWLTFVRSPRARNKIRQWFSKERREEAVEQGKDEITKVMRKQHLPIQRLMSHESLTAIATEPALHRHHRALRGDRRGARVGAERRREARPVARRRGGCQRGPRRGDHPERSSRRPRSGDPGVVVKGVDDLWVKARALLHPVPGDDVIGFVTRGSGVSVHRTDCTNVGTLRAEPDRIVEVEWAPSAATLFLVQIQVEALDRSRLLSDVTRVLSDAHVNILSASVQTTRDRVAKSQFSLRDGRPRAPGPRAERRPAHRRRLRRLPDGGRQTDHRAGHRLTASGRSRVPEPSDADVGEGRAPESPPEFRQGRAGRASGSAAEVGEGLARLGQPLATGRERRLGVRDPLGPLLLAGARQVVLERRDGLLEPGRPRSAPALAPPGSSLRHRLSSASRIACSTARIRRSTRSRSPRGTLPAASQRSCTSRSARLAAARSRTGSSASASTSSASLTCRLAPNSASCSAWAACRASKNASCAPGTGPTARRPPCGPRDRRRASGP
nr:TGS domain-containing protein [Angustibacter aerolatus]